jgi:hypothetical protein
MSRKWQDLLPAKISSVKAWFKKHPKPTQAMIQEVDIKAGFKGQGEVLCIIIDVDNACIRLKKANILAIAKKYSDDVDKWIGKKILITKGKEMMDGELVDSINIEPVGK